MTDWLITIAEYCNSQGPKAYFYLIQFKILNNTKPIEAQQLRKVAKRNL